LCDESIALTASAAAFHKYNDHTRVDDYLVVLSS
jgi:hypothetical protein